MSDATTADTELGALINRQIELMGPMTLADYMTLCLAHPRLGYYTTANAIGRSGDFITAPEISQTFGEMIGVFTALALQQVPGDQIELVELGPGRGTLMADCLRSLRAAAPTAQVDVTLVEISPVLHAEQATRLGSDVRWVSGLGEVATEGPPLVVIANEFFDALPIRQFQKSGDGWHERRVGLRDGERAFGLDPTPLPTDALPEAIRAEPQDSIWEQASAAGFAMSTISDRIATRGGLLLAIDYGYARTQPGETLQAVSGHAYADTLASPGQNDLTAHVDFEALAAPAIAAGLTAHPLLTQADFLAALGISARAENLTAANPSRAGEITEAVARLTGPDRMGTLFKAFCASSPGMGPYPFADTQQPGAV